MIDNESNDDLPVPIPRPETPKTSESLASLRREIKLNIARQEGLDAYTKLSIQKVVNAAENAFADRAILLNENMLLFEQNNGKTTCKSIKTTIVGTAKVLSYEDIVEAKRKRDIKEVKSSIRGRQSVKRKRSIPSQALGKRSRSHERQEAIDEIRASGLEKYCSVLSFYFYC